MKVRLSLISIMALGLPFATAAQTLSNTLSDTSSMLNTIIGLFITLAVVLFFWGLIKYLWSIDSENAHEGLRIMFWGIIAIFVMVSIWGIIALLQNTFKVGGNNAPPPPYVPPEQVPTVPRDQVPATP